MRRAAVVAGALMLLLTAGCKGGSTSPTTPLASPPPSVGGVAPAAVTVTRVRIAALGLDDTQIKPVGLDADHSLKPPPLSAPQTIGVYTGGPVPGDLGPAVIEAHVNANGKLGAFTALSKMEEGQSIIVERSDHTSAVFRVDKVQTIKKVDFPTKAVYGDTEGPELRALTCGPGPLEKLPDGTRSYVNQTIVYAKLVALQPL
jgi:hypothetical protein